MISRRELLAGTAALALLGNSPRHRSTIATPPVTPRIPVRIEQLGRVRVDDYAWLKPTNWLDVWREPGRLNRNILGYLEKENRYCDAVLEATERLQSMLLREMKRHAPGASNAPPVPDGPYAYFTRFAPGAQHPTYLRRPRAGGPEKVLLDAGQLASGKPFLAIRNPIHSPDHRWFAWAEDTTGA